MSRKARSLVALLLAAMTVVAALSVNLMLQTSLTGVLLLAAGIAFVAAIPGQFRPWMAVLSLPLAVVGLYVLWRVLLPLPQIPPEFLATSTTRVTYTVAEQLTYYVQQLRSGLSAYKEDIIPLTVVGAPQLRLLMVTVWYILACIGLWLGLGLRRPLWGAAGLAGVVGVFAAMQVERRGTWLVVVFLVLLAALLGTTRVVSATPAGGRTARWGSLGRAAGSGMAAAALALGVLLAFPGTAQPGVPRFVAWDPLRQAQGPQVVFNWRQNYPQLLDPSRNYPIMRVTSPLPAYWRANTLEVFTGDSWLSSSRFLTPLGDTASRRTVPPQEEIPPGSEAVQTFEITGLNTTYLFAGGYPQELELYYPQQVFLSESMSLRTDRNLGPNFTYRINVTIPRLRPQDLVGLGRDYPQEVTDTYLQLPIPDAPEAREGGVAPGVEAVGGTATGDVSAGALAGQWAREFRDIYDLNESIVGDADDPYEIVLRVEQYVRSAYSYSLSPPMSRYRSPYAAFLFDTREGFCQHFAGAAALLLRLNGVPARVAVGFVTGQEIGPRTYQVTTNNAHSWAEAYFPGVGWVPFEPTPGRFQGVPGPSAYSAGFVDPFPDPTDPGTDSSSAARAESSGVGRLPEDPGFDLEEAVPGTRPIPSGYWVLLGVALIVIGWPALLALARELPSRFGSPERRLRALGRRLTGDLAAWGVETSAALTPDEVAALALSRTGVDLTDPIERLQAVVFGRRQAREEDVTAWRAALRRVRRRLRFSRGWPRTLSAVYGIGSLRGLLPRSS